MLAPVLRSLKHARPELHIHIVAASKTCSQVLETNSNVDSISVMNISKMNRGLEYVTAGKNIRKYRPDAVLVAAGTNPVAGSLVSFFSRARFRVGEDWRGRGFLYTHRLRVNYRIYEAEQNLKLANFLIPNLRTDTPVIELELTPEEITEARNWLSHFNIPADSKLIGIHPGSGKEQEWKRWGIEKFVKLSRQISLKINVVTVFFLGPDENDMAAPLRKMDVARHHIYLGKGSVRKTAARIACCNFFLSNDSGLRQIAVALGIKSFGIFGPTIIRKNFIGGRNHEAIFQKNVLCRPCHYTRWWLACGSERPCLKTLSVDQVIDRILTGINS